MPCWTTHLIDLTKHSKSWAPGCNVLRFDFGTLPGRILQIRNVQLRPPSLAEQARVQAAQARHQADLQLEQHFKDYLENTYPCRLDSVVVGANTLEITGTATGGPLFLCESPLWQHVTEQTRFDQAVALPVRREPFTLTLPRYTELEGRRYDRLYSRWVVARQTSAGYVLESHARYPDAVAAQFDLPEQKPRHKKGLGGFHPNGLAIADLDSLREPLRRGWLNGVGLLGRRAQAVPSPQVSPQGGLG